VLGRDRSYFVRHHSDSTKKFSEIDIFNMLEFLIDNIFVMFGGRVEKSNVLMLLQEERDLDCMYSNRSFEFFRTTSDSGFQIRGGALKKIAPSTQLTAKCCISANARK
jgi:hypothetical protein